MGMDKISPESRAMIYLYTVEDDCCHVSMAQDRCACGADVDEQYANFPTTPAVILAWMKDELRIQNEQVSFNEAEYENRRSYIEVLERDIAVLETIGIDADFDAAFKRIPVMAAQS